MARLLAAEDRLETLALEFDKPMWGESRQVKEFRDCIVEALNAAHELREAVSENQRRDRDAELYRGLRDGIANLMPRRGDLLP